MKVSSEYIQEATTQHSVNLNINGPNSAGDRKQTHGVLFLCKLINGIVDSPQLLDLGKLNISGGNRNTRNKYLFKLPFHRTNYWSHIPTMRSARMKHTSLDYTIHNVTCHCMLMILF